MKNILIACEESQAICKAFRAKGFNAYSCDIQECSGGHPEWHIKGDVLPLLKGYNFVFKTCDGKEHLVGKWDLIMAHPPCTYLTTSGNRWFNIDKYGEKAIQRAKDRAEAALFFMEFANADCEHIAIENPIGIMNTIFRKPNQIIQPWMWGDNATKATCLWTRGLPNLVPDVTEKPEMEIAWSKVGADGRTRRMTKWQYEMSCYSGAERQKMRSKTFNGIANAIVEQWSKVI